MQIDIVLETEHVQHLTKGITSFIKLLKIHYCTYRKFDSHDANGQINLLHFSAIVAKAHLVVTAQTNI